VSSDLANKFLTPVIEKTKEYTSDLKEKIDRSENGTVKYAKGMNEAT
jgi:predicted AlkP superfamily phosphohydrolase/phosphomutase